MPHRIAWIAHGNRPAPQFRSGLGGLGATTGAGGAGNLTTGTGGLRSGTGAAGGAGATGMDAERASDRRNPAYWDNAHTVINKVLFLEVGSDAAAFNRYRANELHYTNYPLEVRQKVRDEMPDQLVETPLLATAYYVFNTTKAPFNDARVRRPFDDYETFAQRKTQ